VREKRTVYKGYEETEQKLVRLWSFTGGVATQQLYAYESGSTSGWRAEGQPTPIGYTGGIPHAALILDPVSATEGRPPMEGLAWMNIRHWVTTSDQNNILRMARCPILFHKLLAEDQELTIAVTRAIGGGSGDSDLRWVEIQGASIEAGFTDIRDIEAKMRQLAMEPLVRQSGTVTATENAIGEAQSQSQAQSWVRLTEATLERLFRIAAAWAKKELDADFRVDIFNDFGVQARAAQASDTIIALMDKGYIEPQTGLAELQHMAIISDGVDVELEIEKTRGKRELDALRGSGLEGLFDPTSPASGQVVPPDGTTNEYPVAASAGGTPMPGIKPKLPQAGSLSDTALNGAQVQSALSIVQEVAAGNLPRDSGVAMLIGFFNLAPDEAEAIMGSVGNGFTPKPAPTPDGDPGKLPEAAGKAA